MGAFFEKALGSTPEDLVAYLGGDWIRVRRAENLVKHFERARRRLAEWRVTEPQPASLSIALPILQGAADEDREELADLWARLLANAMDPNLNSVRRLFIDAVKRMDPPDALVLGFMAENKFSTIRQQPGPEDNSTTYIVALADDRQRRADEMHLSVEHLKTMGLLEGREWAGHVTYSLTLTGREFLRACYPEITTK